MKIMIYLPTGAVLFVCSCGNRGCLDYELSCLIKNSYNLFCADRKHGFVSLLMTVSPPLAAIGILIKLHLSVINVQCWLLVIAVKKNNARCYLCMNERTIKVFQFYDVLFFYLTNLNFIQAQSND